jgi:hypothetical protein
LGGTQFASPSLPSESQCEELPTDQTSSSASSKSSRASILHPKLLRQQDQWTFILIITVANTNYHKNRRIDFVHLLIISWHFAYNIYKNGEYTNSLIARRRTSNGWQGQNYEFRKARWKYFFDEYHAKWNSIYRLV